jgi:hypothetical protein
MGKFGRNRVHDFAIFIGSAYICNPKKKLLLTQNNFYYLCR